DVLRPRRLATEPLLQRRAADARAGAREQRALSDLRSEVPRPRIDDDATRIVARSQRTSHQVVEAVLDGPAELDPAVWRRRRRDRLERGGDVVRRDRLEQHRCDAHLAVLRRRVDDRSDELEELRGVDDRVRDRRALDERLLRELRADVLALAEAFGTDD